MAGIDSLESLLQDELKDIYDAEKQITKALPKMIKKAAADELKAAFQEHLQQTEVHIERLEEVFEQLEMPARGKKCVGMQNLLKEGAEMMAEADDDDTRDALMIAAAQKVEHYEIATYGTLRVWANLLGHTASAALFEETLEEEKTTDQRLTSIAESSVNEAAAEPGAQDADDEQQARAGARARRSSQARVSQMGGARTTRQQAADRAASGRTRRR